MRTERHRTEAEGERPRDGCQTGVFVAGNGVPSPASPGARPYPKETRDTNPTKTPTPIPGKQPKALRNQVGRGRAGAKASCGPAGRKQTRGQREDSL